jgi:FtsH-binding integral membrane protein
VHALATQTHKENVMTRTLKTVLATTAAVIGPLLGTAWAANASTDDGPIGLGIVLMLIMLAGYFLPWMVAWVRSHHNSGAIGVLNLLLGWTFVGWVIALVWACTTPAPVVTEAR